MDDRDPLPLTPRVRRMRRLYLLVITGAAVWLVPWTSYLATSLPDTFDAGQWRIAWVGFDVALASALGFTAWCSWRRRQMVIAAAIVSATLLVCDAWFDVTLDWGTRDAWMSVLSAVFGEVPLAVLLILGARRLLTYTVRTTWRSLHPGEGDPPAHLWQLRMIVDDQVVTVREDQSIALSQEGDISDRQGGVDQA
jgi:hypothetical protein